MKPLYNLHHTNWSKVVSKDGLRPAMCGVYFDKDNECLVGTDGHVVLMIPVDPAFTALADESAVIPVEAFNKNAFNYQVTKDKTTVQLKDGSTRTYPNIDERYPEYRNVIPSENKRQELDRIGIDAELIANIHACLKPAASSKVVQLIFDFNGPCTAIHFKLNSDEKVCGVIMPFLINP